MIKATILGASGYTGAELVRILSQHPEFEVSILSGDSKSGLNYGEVYPSFNHLKMPKLSSIEEVNFDGQDVVLYIWYDNEFGYTKQVIRLAKQIAKVRRLTYY